jgi:two-component system NtrC family sensor kinase
MHKLLERQLRKLGPFAQPPGFEEFAAAVSAAYTQADRNREMVQRSLELASQELLERNRQLREDIERRKQLEVELAQAEKLRAVGQLAAGIAHELNTPIQYVGDNVNFLQKAFQALAKCAEAAVEQEQGRAREKLEFMVRNVPDAIAAALEGCARVAEIVGAMKIFAHPDGVEFAEADINQGLRSTLAVARNAIKYAADVELDLADLPLAECRIGDLNQVFLNLMINAAHAITDRYGPDGPRGRMHISTRLREGDRIIVEVSDDGCGIPEAVRGNIFEPFFTTKAVGRGTGQGLAISRSIVVDRHAGALYFRSTPGSGTTFCVEIPVHACPRACADQLAEEPPAEHGSLACVEELVAIG